MNKPVSIRIAAVCTLVIAHDSVRAEDVAPQPINLILNKPVKTVIPDPDPVIIGEFGNNMIYTAKINATTRKLFFKPVTHKSRDGIDLFLRPFEIGTKKFLPKAGPAVKGGIDNYVYEEDPTNSTLGVAFFHEKGKGIYRAQTNGKTASVVYLKLTDTDKTGIDPEKMASGLSILDWEGKFPPSLAVTNKNYYYPYLLFAAPDKKKGKELWLSDGTAAGTKVFMDINPTFSTVMDPKTHKNVQVPNGSDISPVSAYFPDLGDSTSYGGSAYFSASNGVGWDIYRADSVQNAGKGMPRVTVTTIFHRKFAIDLAAEPSKLAATAQGVFFALPTTNSNGIEELWGYEPGTDDLEVLSDQTGTLQPSDSEFRTGFRFGSYLGYFFTGSDGVTGREGKQAGFSAGTPYIGSLGNLAVVGSSNPRLFTQAGVTVFFVANPGGGEHLYRSDGNPGGYEDLGAFNNVRDITPVVDFHSNGDETGDRVYFVADDNTGTPVLWFSNTFGSGLTGTPEKVMTAGNHPIKNPTHLRRLIGNGCWYLFFVCDGIGTEFETIVPPKGNPYPAQHQVWYTGEFFDNNP